MFLFSASVVSNSLQSHGLQYAKHPCPSPSPGVHSNSCPLSQWGHLPILSPIFPFSSCLQSFPASGYFSMSWLFKSGGQSIGASDSASFLPMKIQSWFPLGWIGWSPCSPRHSQQSCLAPQFESISSSELAFFMVQYSHPYYWKSHSFDKGLCR